VAQVWAKFVDAWSGLAQKEEREIRSEPYKTARLLKHVLRTVPTLLRGGAFDQGMGTSRPITRLSKSRLHRSRHRVIPPWADSIPVRLTSILANTFNNLFQP
jgi:hypothetical protein